MHAYLLISQNLEFKTQIDELSKKLKAKILEFPLSKIEDTRELNSFTSLKVLEPTAILINSIDEATTEAANAFLKNLEEPQDNLYYILTARLKNTVLPTIVSRCQIVKIQDSRLKIKNDEAEKFLEMDIGKKLAYTDRIKNREEAQEFVEKFIAACHQMLHAKGGNYQELSKYLTIAISAHKALKANGNVMLQLTNMIVNMEK